jgi:ornithine cyclodeaminase/alanine dehydrogenase-like protein (mu-crystallin family)
LQSPPAVQLKALSQVRDWDVVEAYSRDAAHLAEYIQDMRDIFPGRSVHAALNAEFCVRGAELVVSTTPSKVAIVKADWLSAGVTVIAMGSDTPGKQELV